MLDRFVLLLSTGIIVACLAAFIWGIVGPFIPNEYRDIIIIAIIGVLALIAVIVLNR